MTTKRKFVVPASATRLAVGGFRRMPVVIAAVALCALAAAGLTAPGRSGLGRVLSVARPSSGPRAVPVPSPSPAGPDIEQKARAAHGWRASIQDSVVTGEINYFDRNGFITRQAAIKILRK